MNCIILQVLTAHLAHRYLLSVFHLPLSNMTLRHAALHGRHVALDEHHAHCCCCRSFEIPMRPPMHGMRSHLFCNALGDMYIVFHHWQCI